MRSTCHSPSSKEHQGSNGNSNHVSWNHNIKTKNPHVVTEEQDVLGNSLDADVARHYVAKEEKQGASPMNSRRVSAKWDRLRRNRKSKFAEEKVPASPKSKFAEEKVDVGFEDSPGGDNSSEDGQGDSGKYMVHDHQGRRRRESLVGKGMRRTLEVLGNLGMSSRDPTPEQQPERMSGDHVRQRPIKRGSLVCRASAALRPRTQSRDPDGVYGGRDSARAPTTQQHAMRQARPKKRESILNRMISLTSKPERKHEVEEEGEPDNSDIEHNTISETDQVAQYGMTNELEDKHKAHNETSDGAPSRPQAKGGRFSLNSNKPLHEGTPLHELKQTSQAHSEGAAGAQSKSRRRQRGSLINLIISITSMKRSDSAGESDYDDVSYQVEDIRVGGTGQTREEAPVKRESRKAQARKRGSIMNMLNGIKKKNLTSGQKPMEEGAADDDQPQERQEALQSESSQGRRNRRSRRNTKDKKVRNSVNLFDRVAAERFSKRGSLVVRQSSVDCPQESSVSTADEPESPYSHRTTISTCPTSNSRMGVNEEDEYQEKIASILYDRGTV